MFSYMPVNKAPVHHHVPPKIATRDTKIKLLSACTMVLDIFFFRFIDQLVMQWRCRKQSQIFLTFVLHVQALKLPFLPFYATLGSSLDLASSAPMHCCLFSFIFLHSITHALRSCLKCHQNMYNLSMIFCQMQQKKPYLQHHFVLLY